MGRYLSTQGVPEAETWVAMVFVGGDGGDVIWVALGWVGCFSIGGQANALLVTGRAECSRPKYIK